MIEIPQKIHKWLLIRDFVEATERSRSRFAGRLDVSEQER